MSTTASPALAKLFSEYRTFGFEIETARPWFRDAAKLFGCNMSPPWGMSYPVYHNGLEFQIKEDGSVRGYELSSPILSESQLDSALSIIDRMKEIGSEANHKCGIHVHVSFPEKNGFYFHRSLDDKAWNQAIRRVWLQSHNQIKQFMPYRSRRYDYCSFQLRNSKYVAVNWQTNYDTIEFRLFNSAISKRWLRRCIMFSLDFVDKVRKDILQTIGEQNYEEALRRYTTYNR